MLVDSQLPESQFAHLKKGQNIYIEFNGTVDIKIKRYLPSKYYSLKKREKMVKIECVSIYFFQNRHLFR